MPEQPSPPINRTPQIVFLIAAAALVIFLFLLGTKVIEPQGPTIVIIAGTLFTVALIATAFEFEINRTGIERTRDENES